MCFIVLFLSKNKCVSAKIKSMYKSLLFMLGVVFPVCGGLVNGQRSSMTLWFTAVRRPGSWQLYRDRKWGKSDLTGAGKPDWWIDGRWTGRYGSR